MQQAITVRRGVTVRELSQALFIPATSIIKVLLDHGVMAQINRNLTDAEVALVAEAFRQPIVVAD
ncbi:MAG: translation initiation factor IF-2 N-terminal domain-containing protein [Gaiellaceae bacterium]